MIVLAIPFLIAGWLFKGLGLVLVGIGDPMIDVGMWLLRLPGRVLQRMRRRRSRK